MSEQKKEKTNPVAKFFQHFIMDPIKTPAEADARIKELLPFVGGFAGGVILFILLGMWIKPVKDLFNVLGFICMAGVFVFGFFMTRAFQVKSRLKKLQCDKCKTVITYGENVTITKADVSFSVSVSKKELSNKDIRIMGVAREYAHVTAACKCQKCGAEKTLRETFLLCEAQTPSEDHPNTVLLEMPVERLRKQIQNCVDNNLENAKDMGVKVSARKTPASALYEFFSDDGSASVTPIGTFTKTVK